MTIGERIKQKRQELQLSQTELAVRANYYDKTAISKIEHAGNDISMKQVRRIADALGVSSAYLMGWEADKEENPEKYQQEMIQRAMTYYEAYKKATPEIQSAVDILLESAPKKK